MKKWRLGFAAMTGLVSLVWGAPVFVDRTAELGLTLYPESVVGNACWFDFNNDGWVDLNAGGRLWLNQAGQSFIRGPGGVTGRVVAADVDNDGWNDLFSWSALKLYRNDAGQGLTEVALPAFPEGYIAGAAAWGDFDGDGWVDLYVSGYENWDLNITYPDRLLLNVDGQSFVEAWSETVYRGRGVAACDFDQDGDQDIYVSNYRLQPNRLWLNNGWAGLADGAAAHNAIATSPGYDGAHSIGSCWGDFDNSGLFDLFVGNFAHPGQPESRFLRNRGAAQAFQFEDMGPCGVFFQESYASPTAGDFDNDGWLDLFFTTVYGGDFPRLFRNQGGFSFANATSLGLAGLDPTYQAAWADFNNDGRLDLLAAGKLFVNEGAGGNWLKVRLQGDGVEVNRSAVGAQVRINLGSTTLTRQVEGGTGQGNQNDLTLHFGLGSHADPVDLEILWPGGSSQTLADVAPNSLAVATFAPPARGGIALAATRPANGVLLDIDVSESVRGFIRVDDAGTEATDRRVLGQTFALAPAGTQSLAVVTNVTIKMGRNFDFNNDPHGFQVAFLKDTDSDGIGDGPTGPTFQYDLSGLHGSQHDYLSFHLPYPVVLETGSTYSVEFWFANADPTHTQANLVEAGHTAANLQVYRGGNAYAAGRMIEADATAIGTLFPVGAAMSPLNSFDMNLVVQGYMAQETANPAFVAWAAHFGLAGSDARMAADPDDDGDDNFSEYAFGGNPTNALLPAIPPVHGIVDDAGTRWLEYVYARRSAADSGLDYRLELAEELAAGPWTNSGYDVVGTGSIAEGMASVTNRISTDPAARFIRLDVRNL